jgi:hypothetical protein
MNRGAACPSALRRARSNDVSTLFGTSRSYDPGQTLTTASVRTRLLLQGMSGAEFERDLSFAKGQGWLEFTNGTLTPTNGIRGDDCIA